METYGSGSEPGRGLYEPAGRAWIVRVVGCGVAAVACLWLLAFLVGKALLPLRLSGQTVMCQGNVFRLTRAHLMYADDYDDRFTPAAGWMDRTLPYWMEERRIHCPAVSRVGENRYGYAMNSALGSAVRGKIADRDNAPLVYDSANLARSASDPFRSLPIPGRHLARTKRGEPFQPGNFVGYAGGNARILLDSRRK